MQYFDFHTHLLIKKMMNPTLLNLLEQVNPDYYANMDAYSDNPRLFTEYLKSQGIKYAVVLCEVAPATSGLVTPEALIDFCRSRDMLLPFASINPNYHPDPAEKLEFYVKDFGVKGLKLMPSYQFFYPNEARLYPLYAKARELGVPVVFHIGSSVFKGTRMKYCDPIHLDDVAVDFPDLTIVMAHSGRGFWYEKCFFLSRLHKNVYMDITGLPPAKLLDYFPELDKNGDKVIFGTDWPAVPVHISENIEAIKSLPLSDRTIEAILYNNAHRIMFE
ncbi:MAG: amidohydrolase [Desulfobacterales bacterium]|nr:amidohydrolase [Desulfobacterales bacterium]